jgi:signal transduction histidine kinase/ligand-binding sensor domain-containing protein/DNA-binding response OmpR family regulator
MKFCSIIIPVCFLSFFSFKIIYSQNEELKFEHLTISEGSINAGVTLIFQDSKGFLWIGNGIGLNRYDGYSVAFYDHLPIRTNAALLEDSKGFIWVTVDGGTLYRYDRHKDSFKAYPFSKKVRRIYEDRTGDIWISTEGDGLGRYTYSTNSVKMYKHNSTDSNSIRDDIVNTVFEDKEGNLWIGTDQGVNKFDRENELFEYWKLDLSPYIFSIIEDDKNSLWIGSSEGLYKLNKTDKSIDHFRNTTSWQYNFIYDLFEDSKNELWIRSEVGISKFDKSTEKFINYEDYLKGLPKYATMAKTPIFEDRTGTLWTLDGSRLAKFIREQERFELIQHNPDDINSLSSDVVLSIYEDRSGILWIGTTAGLDRLNRNRKPFYKMWSGPDDNIPFSKGGIGSILEDAEGLIWLETRAGLYRIDNKNNKKTFYSFKDYEGSGPYIALDIEEDPPGTLWLTTWGDGLVKFNIATGKFNFIRNDYSNPKSLSHNQLNSIVIDKTGTMWVSTMHGVLEKFDRINNTFTHFVYDSIPWPGLASFNIGALYLDKFSNIWICTRGLAVFNIDTHSFKFYHSDSTRNGSLSSDLVYSLLEDSEGTLWLGTSSGLNKYDRKTDTFSCISVKDGLASNYIRGILEDDGATNKNRSLWLLTLNGISKYTPSTGVIKNYGASDGVNITAGLSGKSYLKTSKGDFYFGGANGFVRFNPNDIKDNPFIPPIVITGFKKFNEDAKLDSAITEKKLIELSYDENNISFEFAALNYSSPQKNQYAYKLEGLDKDWVYSGTRRFASYPNLDPGEYVFRVKGSNNDGVWNEEGTYISIIIYPPWWKTWWAYSSYALLFIFALYGIRRYELNRLHFKNQVKLDEVVLKEKEETDKMKSRFFANISHEFRTPLTLILGPAEKISSDTSDNIKKDANIIKRNSRRLLQLINQLLDLSKLESGRLKLEASKGNIVSFVKGVALSFESLSESKDITLKLLPEKEFIEMYFDKEKMMQILTNILSNAFKFTPEEGKITVSIAASHPELVSGYSTIVEIPDQVRNDKLKQSVVIKIRDTGIGITQEEIPKLFDRFYQVDSSHTREYEGTGIGLALTKELVELHHGSIKVESEKGSYTEFTLEFPLGREHLKDDEIIEEKTNVILNPDEVGMKNLSEDVFNRVNKSDSSLSVNNRTPQNDIETNEEKTIILVVEDNYDMRQYIRESLDSNYLIEEAVNGEQGVRKAEKIIPDLIISDMMMPKMDGNELVRILKNDEKTSHIPIILLTAKAGQENKLEGLETGADDYLTKPFDIKELQVRIKNLISIRKKLQEKFSKIGNRTSEIKENLPRFDEVKTGKLSSIDEKFMLRVGEVIEKHISEEEFDIEEFCKEAAMSRTQLHRKLKALTGKSASLYVRSVKLAKAKKMIEDQTGNISEIAYSLGFSSPAYFTRCFKEEFGYPPSEVKK